MLLMRMRQPMVPRGVASNLKGPLKSSQVVYTATKSTLISNTVEFRNDYIVQPTSTHADRLIHALHLLSRALKETPSTSIDAQLDAICQLRDLFQNWTQTTNPKDPPPPPPTPPPPPRVPPRQYPRVAPPLPRNPPAPRPPPAPPNTTSLFPGPPIPLPTYHIPTPKGRQPPRVPPPCSPPQDPVATRTRSRASTSDNPIASRTRSSAQQSTTLSSHAAAQKNLFHCPHKKVGPSRP